MRGWVLLLVALGCKGGTKSADPAAGSGSGSAPADAAVDAAPDAALDDVTSPAARCATACLYLADTPLDDARVAFGRDCKATWPYADDDCDGLLYARNCIYAAFGNVFKRAEWKQRFEGEPWYRPRPAFTDKAFTAVARANVKALVAASKLCGVPPITDADRALAERWFERLIVEAEPPPPGVDESAVQEWEDHRIWDNTQFAYAEKPTADEKRIAITGLYYAAGPGKFDPDAVVVLVFDGKDQLTGFR